jgi:hypothetical protein
MEVAYIAPRIIYAKFNSKEHLCTALLRVVEYYENRRFHNKKVSYREYVKWYNDTKPAIDKPYNKSFFGMFLPGSYFRQFLKNYSLKDLTVNERDLIENLKKSIGNEFLKSRKRYGVIVGFEGIKSSTVKHELSHAIAYLNPAYRKSINKLIKKIPKEELEKMRGAMRDILKYPKEEIDEEIISRLIESIGLDRLFCRKQLGKKVRVSTRFRDELRNNLNSFLIN